MRTISSIAASFTGSNYVDLYPTGGNLGGGAGSVVGWIYLTQNQNNYAVIWGNHYGSSYFSIYVVNNQLNGTASTAGSNSVTVTDPTPLTLNAWHHFAFTYSNIDGARFYTDGTQIATTAGNGDGTWVSSPTWIGGDPPYGNYITAYLDDVAYFGGTVLSAGDISNLASESPSPTSTPTPTPMPVSIAVSPSTQSVTAGIPFNVDVVVNGGGQAFNAAQATVTLSSNLSVTGLHNPTSNACNFQYNQAPITSNPSFAGAIYGSSSTGCKVYTLTINPNSSGTGTITFSNASIKAYADSSEILTGVVNGSFTISGPTPTPTPTGTVLQTIDDSIQGTGQNQWNYVGNWSHCTNCNDSATFYNASQSWNNTTNDYATLAFTGTQVSLYGVTDPRDGIAAVSIDNGTENQVDFYSATRTGNVLLWTSPTLANTAHTLKIRVTGTHNANSSDYYLVLDRANISTATNTLSVTLNNYPLDTYNSSLQLSGTKDASITTVFVNGSSSGVTYPTSTTWQAQISLPSLGNNTFAIYGSDGSNQTATQSITINKHTMGDINGDGVVDLTDASLFAVDWGKTGNFTYPLSDMDSDGTVNLTDLSILAKLITQ